MKTMNLNINNLTNVRTVNNTLCIRTSSGYGIFIFS